MSVMMWIYAVIILLVSEAWSLGPGTNQSTAMNVSTSAASVKVAVIRNLTFNEGNEVNLTCSNKTWKETIYGIWEIHFSRKHNHVCKIAFDVGGRRDDTCNDGKSLRNTSTAQSYLHIPEFSNDDVGVYNCELVYNGGNENYVINVAITVPPIKTSAWFERRGNRLVAVCRAERGKPAANISWSHGRGWTSDETSLPGGLITVESLLEIPEGMETENVTCFIRHPLGNKTILVPKLNKDNFFWTIIIIVLTIVALSMGFLFLALKKLKKLRRCQQPDTSSSKPSPIEDVEEVEPYASYVQRVNSIYN